MIKAYQFDRFFLCVNYTTSSLSYATQYFRIETIFMEHLLALRFENKMFYNEKSSDYNLQ